MKTPDERITATFSTCPRAGQRGMVLVFALVVLLILTVLGVSALRTSSLEQLMSGNTQEQTRAFEAADSGLSHALNDIGANAGYTANPSSYATQGGSPSYVTFGYQVQAATNTDQSTAAAKAYTPTFLQVAHMPRSNKPSGSIVCAAYYDQLVTGTSGVVAPAQDNLHQRLAAGAPCPDTP